MSVKRSRQRPLGERNSYIVGRRGQLYQGHNWTLVDSATDAARHAVSTSGSLIRNFESRPVPDSPLEDPLEEWPVNDKALVSAML